MQFGRFSNGGFYLHKITGYWRGSVSAWFDQDGALLDAEQILQPFGASRAVKRGSKMGIEIERIGARYKHVPAY